MIEKFGVTYKRVEPEEPVKYPTQTVVEESKPEPKLRPEPREPPHALETVITPKETVVVTPEVSPEPVLITPPLPREEPPTETKFYPPSIQPTTPETTVIQTPEPLRAKEYADKIPQPMTQPELEEAWVKRAEQELETFKPAYEEQKQEAMEIIARPWKYKIDEWRDYKKSWEEYSPQAEAYISNLESYVSEARRPPPTPSMEYRERGRETRELRAFGPEITPPLSDYEKLIGMERREWEAFGPEALVTTVEPSEAEKQRFREAAFTEWHRKALEESGGQPIKYDPETNTWYYEKTLKEQSALENVLGKAKATIPGPAAGPAPGSIGEKIQKAVEPQVEAIRKGIEAEESFFESFFGPGWKKTRELEEYAKQYREGEKWKGALATTGATLMSTVMGTGEMASFVVRPRKWVETGLGLLELTISGKARERTIAEVAAHPVTTMGATVGGMAGFSLLQTAVLPKAGSLLKAGARRVAPKVPGLDVLYYRQKLGVPKSTLPEFQLAKAQEPASMFDVVKWPIEDIRTTSKFLKMPAADTLLPQPTSMAKLSQPPSGIPELQFLRMPGVDTALVKPRTGLAEFGPYTPSLSTMVKFLKMPGIRYTVTPPKGLAEFGPYTPSLRTMWEFRKMPGVSTRFPDEISMLDFVKGGLKESSLGKFVTGTKTELKFLRIPHATEPIGPKIPPPTTKGLETVKAIKTREGLTSLFKISEKPSPPSMMEVATLPPTKGPSPLAILRPISEVTEEEKIRYGMGASWLELVMGGGVVEEKKVEKPPSWDPFRREKPLPSAFGEFKREAREPLPQPYFAKRKGGLPSPYFNIKDIAVPSKREEKKEPSESERTARGAYLRAHPPKKIVKTSPEEWRLLWTPRKRDYKEKVIPPPTILTGKRFDIIYPGETKPRKYEYKYIKEKKPLELKLQKSVTPSKPKIMPLLPIKTKERDKRDLKTLHWAKKRLIGGVIPLKQTRKKRKIGLIDIVAPTTKVGIEEKIEAKKKEKAVELPTLREQLAQRGREKMEIKATQRVIQKPMQIQGIGFKQIILPRPDLKQEQETEQKQKQTIFPSLGFPSYTTTTTQRMTVFPRKRTTEKEKEPTDLFGWQIKKYPAKEPGQLLREILPKPKKEGK